MCFSATVSFSAGTALVAVGVLTVAKTRGGGKRELPLAMIPLLFGVQQLTEGFVWISLSRELGGLEAWSTVVYSVFSHVVWPIFVPIAMLLVEPQAWRRKALGVFLALGLTVGLYLLYYLYRLPVTARVVENSIAYESVHFYTPVVLVLYLLATTISGLFSSHWCLRVFGGLAFVLALIAAAVSLTTFVSVWCFYAAVLSLLVYVHFSGPMQACRHLLSPAPALSVDEGSRGRPRR